MKIHFQKYQGAGNDFILIDNRTGKYSKLDFKGIAKLCDRRFGIGADGLMMLEKQDGYAFKMSFFNSDGLPGSMCGNGGRCIAAFAHDLKVRGTGKKPFKFWSSDGEHEAAVLFHSGDQHIVRLKMKDVGETGHDEEHRNYLINTGSPHYIEFVSDCDSTDVYTRGKRIRFSDEFPMGVNVDFVEILEGGSGMETGGLRVRTYERGVEDETFSCGTGAVASAMAYAMEKEFQEGAHSVNLIARGGSLKVDFLLGKKYGGKQEGMHSGTDKGSDPNLPFPKRFNPTALYRFSQVYLEGFATKVFEGDIDWE